MSSKNNVCLSFGMRLGGRGVGSADVMVMT